ncbi:hypothetical protein [Aurantiacibacter gilvus]|uniref:Uncharacterized protein n=1 Tax=Aurantiacibacter gilvus TaxID=3139141 RepID=A0ABU9IAZ0_9SPHN
MALPLAIGLAAPAASAQDRGWSEYNHDVRYDRSDRRERRGQRGHAVVQNRINQLAHDIDHARRNGELNRREVRSLSLRLDTVERAYGAFARNGLSRHDVGTLNWRIDQAYDALDQARYNRDDYRDDRRRYRGRY